MQFGAFFLLVHLLASTSDAVPLKTAPVEGVSKRDGQPGRERQGDDVPSPPNNYNPSFSSGQLTDAEQYTAMRNLVRTYLSAFNELGIETWLMHSALLGWWWSKQLRPQDLDVSMHISEADIFYLASYYNVSTFSFKNPGIPRATRYLLELSPYAKDREQADQLHPADARWIDTKTGLFLNVYAVRYNLSRPVGEGRLRRLSCKDGSEMVDTDLFPLRVTIFEGVPAKVPFCYRELLAMEYGAEALEGSDDTFDTIDEKKSQWAISQSVGKGQSAEESVRIADL